MRCSGISLRNLQTIVDDDVGLKFANHLVHLHRFPTFCVEGPRNVVPKDVDLLIVSHHPRPGHESTNLSRGFVFQTSRAIG